MKNCLTMATKSTFLMGLFAFLMVALAIAGGIGSYSPIPYWDMWNGTLNFGIKVSDGDWTTWWAQHNEHRIVLSRILFWMDINWFNGLGGFLIVVNYLIVGTTAFFLFRIVATTKYRLVSKHYQTLIGFFLVGWVFQWIQSQNFIWGFQSQFLLVQLLPLGAFFYLSRSESLDENSNSSFLIACLFGISSVGTMANGLIVLPMMLFYAILYKVSKSKVAILAALAIISAFLYLIDYVSPVGHGSLFKTIMHDPIGLIKYSLTYLGSPFYYFSRGFHGGDFALFAGLFFLSLYSWAIRDSFNKFKNDTLTSALIFYIAFIVVTAIATGGGRLVFGVQQALESRYTTPAIMAWSALLIVYSPSITIILNKYRKTGKVFVVCFCLSILSLQLKALSSESHSNFLKRVAGLALVMGVPDEDRIGLIYHSTNEALNISLLAKQKKLSFFDIEPYASIDKPIVEHFLGGKLDECIGYIDTLDLVKGQSKFGRVGGWIYNRKSGSPPEFVEFFNQANELVGYAIVGGHRIDLEKSVNPRAVDAGFEGYINLTKSGRLIILQGRNADCMTEPLNVPIKPFIVTDIIPDSDKTQILANQIQDGNQWVGSDFDHSEFKGMAVYGSYVKGDFDKGSIELIINPGDRIFYRSGPTSGTQLLEIRDQNISIVLPKAERWVALEFNALSSSNGRDVLIRMVDNGSGWGEWSAIAVRK